MTFELDTGVPVTLAPVYDGVPVPLRQAIPVPADEPKTRLLDAPLVRLIPLHVYP